MNLLRDFFYLLHVFNFSSQLIQFLLYRSYGGLQVINKCIGRSQMIKNIFQQIVHLLKKSCLEKELNNRVSLENHTTIRLWRKQFVLPWICLCRFQNAGILYFCPDSLLHMDSQHLSTKDEAYWVVNFWRWKMMTFHIPYPMCSPLCIPGWQGYDFLLK